MFEYVVQSASPHPLRQMQAEGQRTFVYLVDSSEQGKQIFEQICAAQKVPEGPIGKAPFVNPRKYQYIRSVM